MVLTLTQIKITDLIVSTRNHKLKHYCNNGKFKLVSIMSDVALIKILVEHFSII